MLTTVRMLARITQVCTQTTYYTLLPSRTLPAYPQSTQSLHKPPQHIQWLQYMRLPNQLHAWVERLQPFNNLPEKNFTEYYSSSQIKNKILSLTQTLNIYVYQQSITY